MHAACSEESCLLRELRIVNKSVAEWEIGLSLSYKDKDAFTRGASLMRFPSCTPLAAHAAPAHPAVRSRTAHS